MASSTLLRLLLLLEYNDYYCYLRRIREAQGVRHFLIGRVQNLRVHDPGVDGRNRDLERRELQAECGAHRLHGKLGSGVRLWWEGTLCARAILYCSLTAALLQPESGLRRPSAVAVTHVWHRAGRLLSPTEVYRNAEGAHQAGHA